MGMAVQQNHDGYSSLAANHIDAGCPTHEYSEHAQCGAFRLGGPLHQFWEALTHLLRASGLCAVLRV